jgi:hypothetical protein
MDTNKDTNKATNKDTNEDTKQAATSVVAGTSAPGAIHVDASSMKGQQAFHQKKNLIDNILYSDFLEVTPKS